MIEKLGKLFIPIIQLPVGVLIILDIADEKAIGWIWAISGGTMLAAYLIAGIISIAKDKEF